jgi:iron complex transport system ATP-binding protein
MGGLMLEVRKISCGYGKRVVVRQVSFGIKEGEFVGVIGPNGSGKTTLIRAITGFLPLAKGSISLEGREVHQMARRELAQKVAVVTQSPETAFSLSVEEFVLLGRVPHWGTLQFLETTKDWEIAGQAMELTKIDHLRGRRMTELSGGERQLVFVTRALAQEPHVLLLDEPTAHLDIGHQAQIMGLLKQLNEEHALTIVMVLHDLTLASLSCERLILLHQGRLCEIGPPRRVLTKRVLEQVYRTAVRVMENSVEGRPIILPAVGKGV